MAKNKYENGDRVSFFEKELRVNCTNIGGTVDLVHPVTHKLVYSGIDPNLGVTLIQSREDERKEIVAGLHELANDSPDMAGDIRDVAGGVDAMADAPSWPQACPRVACVRPARHEGLCASAVSTGRTSSSEPNISSGPTAEPKHCPGHDMSSLRQSNIGGIISGSASKLKLELKNCPGRDSGRGFCRLPYLHKGQCVLGPESDPRLDGDGPDFSADDKTQAAAFYFHTDGPGLAAGESGENASAQPQPQPNITARRKPIEPVMISSAEQFAQIYGGQVDDTSGLDADESVADDESVDSKVDADQSKSDDETDDGAGWPNWPEGTQGPADADASARQISCPIPDARNAVGCMRPAEHRGPCVYETQGSGFFLCAGDECSLYSELERVLALAVEQAAEGKGAERHASDGERFEEQQICQLGRWMGKDGTNHFQVGQAVKKALESTRLEPEAAKAELLGAVNYLAAAYLAIDDS